MYDLGLSREDFWALHMEELNALLDRHITKHGSKPEGGKASSLLESFMNMPGAVIKKRDK